MKVIFLVKNALTGILRSAAKNETNQQTRKSNFKNIVYMKKVMKTYTDHCLAPNERTPTKHLNACPLTIWSATKGPPVYIN